jgi:hypothetical protein
MANDGNEKLPIFNGSSVTEAVTHLTKFKILATVKQWTTDDVKINRFILTFGEHPLLWFGALDATEKDTFAHLEDAYNGYFVNQTNRILAEQELLNLNLKNYKDINELWAAILTKGSEAGKSGEDLSTPFLMALPQQMRQYCLSTDNPNLKNFLKRAKTFSATTEQKQNTRQQGAFAMTDGAMMSDSTVNAEIAALTKTVGDLKLLVEKGADRGRSRYGTGRPSTPFRGRGRSPAPSRQRYQSPFRQRDQSRARQPFRSPSRQRYRSPSRPRYDRSPSSSRPRYQCWNCGKIGHRAATCWFSG